MQGTPPCAQVLRQARWVTDGKCTLKIGPFAKLNKNDLDSLQLQNNYPDADVKNVVSLLQKSPLLFVGDKCGIRFLVSRQLFYIMTFSVILIIKKMTEY